MSDSLYIPEQKQVFDIVSVLKEFNGLTLEKLLDARLTTLITVMKTRTIFVSFSSLADGHFNEYFKMLVGDENVDAVMNAFISILKLNARDVVDRMYRCKLYLDTLYYALLKKIYDRDGARSFWSKTVAVNTALRKVSVHDPIIPILDTNITDEDRGRMHVIQDTDTIIRNMYSRLKEQRIDDTAIAFITLSSYILHYLSFWLCLYHLSRFNNYEEQRPLLKDTCRFILESVQNIQQNEELQHLWQYIKDDGFYAEAVEYLSRCYCTDELADTAYLREQFRKRLRALRPLYILDA